MVVPLLVATSAFQVFTLIRESVNMYMFIIEESIQTANLATWLLSKAELYDDAINNANWVKSQLAQQLKDITENPLGNIAYPLNLAYNAFSEATIHSIDESIKALNALKTI